MSKKISEILIEKTVHRPVRDEYGNLYYEEHTFLMKYNPSNETRYQRTAAKVLDVVLFFVPLLFFVGGFYPCLGIATVFVIITALLRNIKQEQLLERGYWAYR